MSLNTNRRFYTGGIGEPGQKYRPSNGSEGEMFRARWCAECKHDDYDAGRYCEILGATLCLMADDPDYPQEWTFDDDGHPICTAFEIIQWP